MQTNYHKKRKMNLNNPKYKPKQISGVFVEKNQLEFNKIISSLFVTLDFKRIQSEDVCGCNCLMFLL